VRNVLAKLGKQMVMPEEIIHYSEWFYAMKDRIAANQVLDFSGIAVTVHPACHYYKLVEGDAIYDPDVYGGQRTAIVTGLVQALGAEVRNYSTWFDCCGFGFRHILVQRDFTRSFATQRKIEVMKEEANPDVVLTHDTGCVTTLDKSQFAAQAHQKNVGVPVMSEAQFAALAMGAHPYKVCQLHWHSTDYRPLLEKMGIDWQAAWAEFEHDADRLRRGEQQFLTWEDVDA
jgi:heterodisulfide reductase subunit B